MMAITIWQPWASLIAAGAKPYEWRGWPPPKRLIGQRIAIHAGARAVRRDEVASLLYQVQKAGGADTSLVPEIALPLLETWHATPRMLPLSSILCTAQLGEPMTAAQYARGRGFVGDSDRIAHNKWGWPLTDVRPLEPFVPQRGAQGFFEVGAAYA